MSCYIGRIIVVHNDGTIIIGNVTQLSSEDTANGGSDENKEVRGEVSLRSTHKASKPKKTKRKTYRIS